MDITRHSTVSNIATEIPATVRVFQEHEIDFCCGGKRPLADACADRGLDVDAVLAELRAAGAAADPARNWADESAADLVSYIQARFHEPLRRELPRLTAMLARVVERHGQAHPAVLLPLQATFDGFQRDLLAHMQKEDAILFPAIADLERGVVGPVGAWLDQPIAVMEAEHDEAGRALEHMRALTAGYAPPEGACPTFRGLYYGLAELEREMHWHVHLENHVLFPRAATLAGAR